MTGLIPIINLLPFLEDARKYGILRTNGPLYRFRHINLQIRLANRYLSINRDPFLAFFEAEPRK